MECSFFPCEVLHVVVAVETDVAEVVESLFAAFVAQFFAAHCVEFRAEAVVAVGEFHVVVPGSCAALAELSAVVQSCD